MKIITRYVLRHFASIFGVALFGFGGIYLVVDFFEKLDDIIEKKAAAADALFYFTLKLPAILVQGIPMAGLLAALIGLGLLQRNREIIALRAAGCRAWVYAGPMVAASIVLGVLTFVGSETVGRSLSRKAEILWQERIAKKGAPLGFVQENVWYRGENVFLQARTYNPAAQVFQGVSIYRLDEHFRLRQRLDAQRVVWTGSSWSAEKGSVLEWEDGTARHTTFDRMAVPLNLEPKDLSAASALPEDLRWDQLFRYAQKVAADGYNAVPYVVELHTRAASACAAFILGLIGVSLSLHLGHRGGIALGITLALALTFAYLVLFQTGVSLARSETLPVSFGVWTPNILFAGVGVALWRRAPQ